MVHVKAMGRPEITGELRKRLNDIKQSFYSRCYHEYNPKYKNYGGRGVTVAPEWHRLKGFLEDFDSLPGWNEEDFLAGNLQLDKDIKVRDSKIYSKDTCMWVTPEENVKVKPSYQRSIIGVNEFGDKYEFYNQREFAKEHPEIKSPQQIGATCKGNRPYYNGWYFYYKGEQPNPPLVYEITKGSERFCSFRQRTVERYIRDDMPVGKISRMVNKNFKRELEGWAVSWYLLPC